MLPAYAPSISRAIERPLCPKCATQMHIARIDPDQPGFERHTFECPACQYSENTVGGRGLTTMTTRYVALIDGKDGAYGLTVPDLPGCTSVGSTITEVLNNAAEAVRLWLSNTVIAPCPRAYDDVAKDQKVKEAIARGAMLAIVVLAD